VLSTLANQAATALEKAFLVQQMEEMAIRDGLTGVFNHRYFHERLEEEFAKAERYNKDLSLLLLDVDFFKKFNDLYGHQEGDHVLKTVAKLLQEAVRNRVDTVSRYGGEEFSITLPESDINTAFETAERIRSRIEAYHFENSKGGEYHVTVSIGIASYPFDARSPSKLIHAADTALYESKSRGRNRTTRFSNVKK
jgi:diguanylate cyclase (GGDEF)-like protein